MGGGRMRLSSILAQEVDGPNGGLNEPTRFHHAGGRHRCGVAARRRSTAGRESRPDWPALDVISAADSRRASVQGPAQAAWVRRGPEPLSRSETDKVEMIGCPR